MITLLLLSTAFGLLAFAARERNTLSRQRLYTLPGVSLACVIGALWVSYDPYLLPKTIARMAMPAGALFAVLWLAPFVAFYRRQHRTALVCAAVAIAFGVSGNEFVGGALMGKLEAPFRADHPLSRHVEYDAVMVLGGGSGGDRRHYFVSRSGDRIVTGARLYLTGRTPKLITSGSTVPGSSSVHNSAEATTTVWKDLGIPESAILQVPGPHNTREEIKALNELIQENGWTEIGLVTSAWHLRRAMRLVEREGLSEQVAPIPSDFRASNRWDGFYSVIPTGQGFSKVHSACWEFLGILTRR